MNRIEKALDSLLIQSCGEIKSRIEQVSFCVDIEETNSKGYCYCLKIDGNGNVRIQDLIEYIDTKIVDYAIPKKEIDEAKEYQETYGSTSRILALEKKARQLFTSLEKTGEGGEILLYILVQEFLKIPQLISKMSIKTSGALHYQGADGIHVSYDKSNNLLNLYWGEAKMYQDIKDGIKACLESVKDFLLDSYSIASAQERDLQLITSNLHANINDSEFEDLLVKYFDKDNDLSNHLVYKGICFIGFDFDKYPTNNLIKTTQEVKNEIENELHKWHAELKKRIKSHEKLDLKEIHVFLMPFPSVAEFRKYYLETIK